MKYPPTSPLNLWSFGAFQVAHFAHFDMANHRPRPELCIAHGVLHVARMRRSFASSSAQQAQRYLQRKKRWFYGDFIVISIKKNGDIMRISVGL